MEFSSSRDQLHRIWRGIGLEALLDLEGGILVQFAGVEDFAFWVNGRLVGSSSWVVGSEAVIDGRARFAKRCSIVVKTSGSWTAEVEPDWVRFKAGSKADALFEAVRQYAQQVFGKL